MVTVVTADDDVVVSAAGVSPHDATIRARKGEQGQARCGGASPVGGEPEIHASVDRVGPAGDHDLCLL